MGTACRKSRFSVLNELSAKYIARTKALAAMGLSVSDAVRVLLTRVAAEKALPFEIKVPNAATVAAMKEARKGGLRSSASVPALMAELGAEAFHPVEIRGEPISETILRERR